MIITEMKDSEINFILSSWLLGYRKSRATIGVANNLYFKGQEALIRSILERSSCLVLRDSNDPDLLYGYIVVESLGKIPVTHWLFIKDVFRNFGFAKKLATHVGITLDKPFVFTHTNRVGDKLTLNNPNALYNPYLLHWNRHEKPVSKSKRRVPRTEQPKPHTDENNAVHVAGNTGVEETTK